MKQFSKIVTSSATYSLLGQQLAAQKMLHQQLLKLLPEPLDNQLKAAVLQQGKLSLFVPSPVWASRFRYLLPQLQKALRKNGMRVDRVHTRILPNVATKPNCGRKKQRLTLSREVSRQLQQSADAIGDPLLRNALLRLSRHVEMKQ